MPVKEKNKEKQETIILDGYTIANNSEKTKSCFIITPIGSDDDRIRRHIEGVYNAALEPILSELNFKSNLPHKILTPGSITRQIVKSIYDSDLIIANLTGINPNVMYELALTHCFNKPLIIIAEDGTDLPFDIINERTLFYKYDPEGVFELQADLRNAITELQGNNFFKSTVLSYIQEFNFDSNVKDTKEDANNEISNTLRMLVRRIDRIDYNIRKNSGDEKTNDTLKFSRTYRIYQTDSTTFDFGEKISDLVESFRTSNILVRYRILDNYCSIYFMEMTPSVALAIESELDSFCALYNLVYRKL